MTRVIEHHQDAATGEEVFELRVFQLRDGDVRACVVPADLVVNLDMMADMSEPVAQAYLNALALCETESVATLWVHHPLGLFPPRESTGAGTVRRAGSHSLGEFPLDVVRIECERCGRAGSYRGPSAKESTIAATAGGFCVGFIAGASDMIEAATQNFVCRPADTTPGQIEDLFIAYLHRHPDKGEQAAVGLIGSALGEAFHCSFGLPPSARWFAPPATGKP
jgi:hypothetical protein